MWLRLLCLLSLALAGCTREDPYTTAAQEDFFPLEVGQVRIYQVDSVLYDPSFPGVRDSSTVFFREEVVDTFYDDASRLWYRIDRFERAADTLPWVISEVLAAAVADGQALWQEQNLTFVKLVFPFDTLSRWNGHAYFDPFLEVAVAGEPMAAFKGWEYQVASIQVNVDLQGKLFAEVVEVRQADKDLLVEYRYAREQYAREVGLIFREWKILDTQQIDPEKPWEEKAEKGFILRQILLDHF